jgi:DHA2 family multidrug resistance protein-like MFS transporter
MGALLVLGPMVLPEYRDPEAGRLDIPSAALALVAVLSVIYGVKRVAEDGVAAEAALFIVLGLAVAIAFAFRQLRLSNPLIDLALFRSRAFSASLMVNVLGFFVAFGSFLFIAQYLQLVLGMGPFEAGLWTVPSAVAFIAGSTLTPIAVGKTRPAHVMAAGLVLAAAGFLLLTRSTGGQADLAIIVAGYSVFSLGLAPVFTLATDLIVGTVEPRQAGAASGIAETSSEFGGALGIAILGSIITAIYRSGMTGLVADGVSAQEIDVASDTLGGAVAVAVALPDRLGLDLLDVAQTAFIQAFRATAAICAVVALAAAILAALLLQAERSGSEVGESRATD